MAQTGNRVAAEPLGAPNFLTSQNALSGTAEEIFDARPTRTRAVVKNADGSVTVYVGSMSDVTSSTGIRLLAGESIALYTSAAIYAIAASGTPTVDLLEEWY